MKAVLVTGPSATPVSLDEIKTHARITHSLEDDYLTGLLGVAVEHVEQITGRKLVSQVWSLLLDKWPTDAEILLPFGKVQSVASIKYKDQGGAETTWSSENYVVDTDSVPGRIVIAYDKNWPSDTLFNVNPIVIEFTTGYGATSASIPESIKHAIKLLVAHWVENREATVQLTGAVSVEKVPIAVDSLLWPYRLFAWEDE